MAIVKLLNKAFEGENVDKLPTLKMYDEIESKGSILLFDASKIDTQSVENDAYLKNIFSENCLRICGDDSNQKMLYMECGILMHNHLGQIYNMHL